MFSVIIVNWNTGNYLAQCLACLDETAAPGVLGEVVVIDNYSSDDSFQRAQKQYMNIYPTFIGLERNAGFAAANNIGLKHLKEKNISSHVLLLNPDTCVHADLWAALADAFEHHPNAGVVGPRLLDERGELQPSVRRLPTLGVLLFLFLKLHRFLGKTRLWQRYMATDITYDQEQAVDQVMGAAFAIRDRVWQGNDERGVGLLDGSFWLWFEEVDYCSRVKEKGWEIWYTPQASVTHRGAISFNQLVGLGKSWPFLKSALLYARKHLGFLSYVVLLAITPLALGLSFLSSGYHLYVKWYDRHQRS